MRGNGNMPVNGLPPAVWEYGTDYAHRDYPGEEPRYVIAVYVSGNVDPGGLTFRGPVLRTPASYAALGKWAEPLITEMGGYVHLIPADTVSCHDDRTRF